MEKRCFKRIIFDMDGTLADTAKASLAACNRVARQMGLPLLTAEQVKRTIGYATPEFYHRLLPGVDAGLVQRFGDEVELLEADMIRRLGPQILFGGVAGMLKALAGRGVPLYIASTGSQEHVDITLSAGGIRHFFASVHCGQPQKVDMVRGIVGPGGPGGWLMVGDKAKDVQAARGSGIAVAGAGFGYCGPKEAPLFDFVLDSPADILDVVVR